MTPLLSDLTATGLALWRLRWSADHQLWCCVQTQQESLVIVVFEAETNRIAIREAHEDICLLVDRAQELRDRYLSAGWELVDVDLDEPD